eukprot:8746289-Pyramimonas_sp.AAC.1
MARRRRLEDSVGTACGAPGPGPQQRQEEGAVLEPGAVVICCPDRPMCFSIYSAHYAVTKMGKLNPS